MPAGCGAGHRSDSALWKFTGQLAIVPYWDYRWSVRLIALSTLRAFWQRHPNAEQALRAWADEVRTAQWKQPADIKASFGNASILKSRRAVFNVKGNDYRIVAAIAYRMGVVFVKFVGTHADYDQIDANTVEPEP